MGKCNADARANNRLIESAMEQRRTPAANAYHPGPSGRGQSHPHPGHGHSFDGVMGPNGGSNVSTGSSNGSLGNGYAGRP